MAKESLVLAQSSSKRIAPARTTATPNAVVTSRKTFAAPLNPKALISAFAIGMLDICSGAVRTVRNGKRAPILRTSAKEVTTISTKKAPSCQRRTDVMWTQRRCRSVVTDCIDRLPRTSPTIHHHILTIHVGRSIRAQVLNRGTIFIFSRHAPHRDESGESVHKFLPLAVIHTAR